ncbi:hypothetical protein NBRC10512_007354 [Rhodotorula toruloides]
MPRPRKETKRQQLNAYANQLNQAVRQARKHQLYRDQQGSGRRLNGAVTVTSLAKEHGVNAQTLRNRLRGAKPRKEDANRRQQLTRAEAVGPRAEIEAAARH